VDTFTQMALGAAIGDAGFGRRLGNRAVLLGAGAGLVPDLDLAVNLMGDWTSLVHHRGWSHSLIVLTLVSPLVGWIGWRWDRRRNPYLAWALLAFLCLVTHPLLDVCTSYGTLLLVPVSWTRLSIDAIGIIDLLYSLPLVVALVWSWRLRNRPAPSRIQGRHVTAAALALTTALLLAGLSITTIVRSRAREDLASLGFTARRIRATPPPVFTPLRRVVARDARGDVMVCVVSPWSERPYRFTRIDWPDDPLVDRALATEQGRIFTWFADGFITARVSRDPAGRTATVHLGDQRYGMVTAPSWSPFGVSFTFPPDEGPPRAVLEHPRGRIDVGRELHASWRLLLGR
jgi:inner membrane protein